MNHEQLMIWTQAADRVDRSKVCDAIAAAVQTEAFWERVRGFTIERVMHHREEIRRDHPQPRVIENPLLMIQCATGSACTAAASAAEEMCMKAALEAILAMSEPKP